MQLNQEDIGMSNTAVSITRKIEFDMGHRVPQHRDKCMFLHGHRYTLEARVTANTLEVEGPQSGMVVDFGFLKGLMTQKVGNVFDHATTLQNCDPIAHVLASAAGLDIRKFDSVTTEFKSFLTTNGTSIPLKLVVVRDPPTAENLARIIWNIIQPEVPRIRPDCKLVHVRLYETPNCWADVIA